MVTSLVAFAELSTNTTGSAAVAAPQLGLAIQRTENSQELLLTLSGTEPTTYVVLSKTNLSDAQWTEESRLDARVTTTITVPLQGRGTGFFTVVPEDEFVAGSAGSRELVTAESADKTTQQAAGSGKDWFVDCVRGHDNFDGKMKQRNGSNGPFATVRKAMTHAAAGDSVTIAEGQYAESLNLKGKNIAVKIEGKVILH